MTSPQLRLVQLSNGSHELHAVIKLPAKTEISNVRSFEQHQCTFGPVTVARHLYANPAGGECCCQLILDFYDATEYVAAAAPAMVPASRRGGAGPAHVAGRVTAPAQA